jgi:hypothetical protein
MDMTADAYGTGAALHATPDFLAEPDLSVFLTARRHVDYGRVRSAMCRAF